MVPDTGPPPEAEPDLEKVARREWGRDPGTVTRFLQRWREGDPEALDHLIPILYEELRAVAAAYLGREREGHTLTPTALVHEAFLRLVDRGEAEWESRTHFLGIAARLMRQILVDYARRHAALKRGAGFAHVALHEASPGAKGVSLDLVAVDEALTRLAALDERQARVVELRFFAGLGVEATAEVLGVSPATVKRDWRSARAWLFRELEA